MNSTLLIWTTKQKACWEKTLNFPATAEHLETWAQTIDKEIGLSDYLQNLTVDDLMSIWKEGSKHKEPDTAPAFSLAAAKLKAVWRATMDFSPRPWHLTLFQKHIEQSLGIDTYFENVTIDQLIEIIRLVATRQKVTPPDADSAQPASKAILSKTKKDENKPAKPNPENKDDQI